MKAGKNSDAGWTPRARRLLDMQGFAAVPEEALQAVRPWLRVAPAVTAGGMLLGTLTQSPVVLSVLVPFALLGALLPTHPFDVFYNHCARFVLGKPDLPENPLQRRICCGVASGWAIATAVLFLSGHPTAATVTGLIATTGCALPALTDFCVPSYVLHLLGRTPAACVVPISGKPERHAGMAWTTLPPPAPEPVTHTMFVSGGGRPC